MSVQRRLTPEEDELRQLMDGDGVSQHVSSIADPALKVQEMLGGESQLMRQFDLMRYGSSDLASGLQDHLSSKLPMNSDIRYSIDTTLNAVAHVEASRAGADLGGIMSTPGSNELFEQKRLDAERAGDMIVAIARVSSQTGAAPADIYRGVRANFERQSDMQLRELMETRR